VTKLKIGAIKEVISSTVKLEEQKGKEARKEILKIKNKIKEANKVMNEVIWFSG